MADDNGTEETSSHWLEISTAIMMTVTAVVLAWSAYQGTTWASEAATLGREAGAARTESAKDLVTASLILSNDQASFTSWVLAETSGNEAAAESARG